VNLLFMKHTLAWPRSSGHDVHTFHMMQACAAIGHDVGLATVVAPRAEATAGLPLAYTVSLSPNGAIRAERPSLTYFQERYRSYWGVEPSQIAALHDAERRFSPDAVVVSGLDVLPYLAGARSAVRVWYAADEWVWHHLTLVQPRVPATWSHLKAAAMKGVYERAYAPLIDRAWVVSEAEGRAMRWFAGVRDVDIVPNGVDADHFRPMDAPVTPESAVFWGRLDFEPNVQGLMWFCDRVWPELRREVPGATFTIIGFSPGPQVRALAERPGIVLRADLPDLRTEVGRHAVVVLPFVSGGGIKNKLLEAAALGKPIVCTPRVLSGLRHPDESGLVAAETPRAWVAALLNLWKSDTTRVSAGAAARAWVQARHTWAACAAEAVEGVKVSLARRGAR
jgi:polysaccharide biosynthesis protein PslH